jgi:DNA-binding LacI/PurR family transcriptional regulator
MERRRNTRRFTIGYLTPNISDGVSLTRWHGMLDAAQEQDVNLICFPGAYWRDPGPRRQANAIYDLVSTEYLDGLVLGNIVRGDLDARDEFKDFYENHLRMPAVGIRETLNGIPYVPLDNYQGMREAVVHLVEVHAYRRIAFLRGPERHPYAQERYRAYTDVLQEYGLLFEPDIV